MTTLRGQLRANAIAILSLTIALSSFSYTAWRTERSEANRTTRQAAFQMLVALGQMQEVVYRAHYDHDAVRGSPRSGWVYVQAIRDFGTTMPAPVPERAQALLVIWRDHWEGLGAHDDDEAAIDDALADCRESVVAQLRALR
jgi:hypothetical protein